MATVIRPNERGDGDLDVTIHPKDSDAVIVENGVEFVSFVNDKTFGKPPIIAPGTDDYKRDEADVLYVNTGNLLAARVRKS